MAACDSSVILYTAILSAVVSGLTGACIVFFAFWFWEF